ncbi:MAG: hypothetical protein OQK75_05015 [Gammaproteobacteria bacterium]|nr:hypothetical protein [Gammaproteobacteria bacterium]MCW8987015.1 hypothetical protein [Gammaproteobacteria bacterium]MCW9030417.1 hypothetical protein [Gammaproteobacteria bacterium]
MSYSQESVLAVTSNDGKIYQNFYTRLKESLDKGTKISKISYSDINNTILNSSSTVVSIGAKAAKSVSKYKINANVIYSFIPDDELLQSKIPCKKTTCYKIYINQPVNRYVQLFKALFPEGKKLAFAHTEKNSIKSQQVKSALKKNDLIYKDIHIQKDNNASRIFINELNNDDVLLALPNHYIYNSENAKSIILSTYHANVPIIAYSKSFAKAGALISLYSSVDNVADKTAKIIGSIIVDGTLSQKEYYPDDFMIEINSAVARSLNINISSENILKSKIR